MLRRQSAIAYEVFLIMALPINSHILITGGTQGVGRATTELLLRQGVRVSVCARTANDLECLAEELSADNLLTVQADVRSMDDLVLLKKIAFDRFGPITGVVNNAGEAIVGELHRATPEELLTYFDLKVVSALRLVRLVLPSIPEGGSIVNVAGAAGVDPTALLGIAGVANAALRNFSRMLADELADRKIRVNTVNPGTLDTRLGKAVMLRFAEVLGVDAELVRDEMYGSLPLGRVPMAHDVAQVILFFLGDESSMLTGAELTPDGGTLIRRFRG